MAKIIDHPDADVVAQWATLVIEVRFAPQTGSKNAWEVYGRFYDGEPNQIVKFWSSHKTEISAMKKAKANARLHETTVIVNK